MISLIVNNLNRKLNEKYPMLNARASYNKKYILVHFNNPDKLTIRYSCDYVYYNCIGSQEIMSDAINRYRSFILKKYFD